MNVQSALTDYLDSLNSLTTRINYEIALREFLKGAKTVDQVDRNRVEKYKKKLLTSKSPQTAAARMSAVRGFCDYCWTQGFLGMDPSLGVKNSPADKYKNAKNVTLEEFQALLATISIDSLKGIRDLLLLRMLYICGDVDEVLEHKWNDPTPGFLTKLKKLYAKQLMDQIDLKTLKEGYVFFSQDSMNPNVALSRSTARKIIQKHSVDAGYPENYFDFQALKRLRAKQIYDETGSVEAVSQFCKHKSIKATKALIKTF